MTKAALFTLLALPMAAVAQVSRPVSFEDYPVTAIFHGQPAQPVLKTRGQRMFRTAIREGAKKGANFAGHYAIAAWGCGSGCASMAVVDLESGAVYEGPFGVLPDARIAFPPSPEAGLSYLVNSRLFVARGCPNEDEKACGTYYYEWTGSGFKLLRRVSP